MQPHAPLSPIVRSLLLGGDDWSIGRLFEVAQAGDVEGAGAVEHVCRSSVERPTESTVTRAPLKVAMLAWETTATLAAGSVAPHVTDLALALHGAGHAVHVFTRAASGATSERRRVIEGVTYQEVAFPTRADFVREIEGLCDAVVASLLEAERSAGRFDVIHGHDWLVGPAVATLESRGRACIFTMHSVEPGRSGRQSASGGRGARIRAIEKQACRVASHVVVLSAGLKQDLYSHYAMEGSNVAVIPTGIHGEQLAHMEWQDDWTGNTKRGKGFDDVMAPMFLFSGRMCSQKGPDMLLDAIPFVLEAQTNAKFLFVGDGAMRAQLEAKVHGLGLGHAVNFPGSIKSGTPHMQALLKSCDAVVVPSRSEPFSTMVLEAWGAGKPVVATSCAGPLDLLSPDQDGLLVEATPDSIAWGIRKICENFDHARWMGSRGQEKVLDKLSWSAIARQVSQLYYEQVDVVSAPAAVLNQLRLLGVTLGAGCMPSWMDKEFARTDVAAAFLGGAGSTSNRRTDLRLFDACLRHVEEVLQCTHAPVNMLKVDEVARVLAYERGGCIFAFNFHATAKLDACSIPNQNSVVVETDLFIALDTDEPRFGGSGCADRQVVHTGGSISVALAASSAVVVAPARRQKELNCSGLLNNA